MHQHHHLARMHQGTYIQSLCPGNDLVVYIGVITHIQHVETFVLQIVADYIINDSLHAVPDMTDIVDCHAAGIHADLARGAGDKGFFLDTPTWDDLTVKTALNAAILPSGTAMHVEYERFEPSVNDRCRKLLIPEKNYSELVEFVLESFQLENDKPVLIPNRGYWDNDNFYEAYGNYHLFKTCNTWTNNALQAAGIRTGVHVLFQDGILYHLPKN